MEPQRTQRTHRYFLFAFYAFFAVNANRDMKDLANPGWIKLKGALFLALGLLSSALLIFEHPEVRVVFLLALSVWCFSRFYYFAFYVIEHYVDPCYRFSGLWSFEIYLWSRRRRP